MGKFLGGFMDLRKTCKEFGLPSPQSMLGMDFQFTSGEDTIIGRITGVSTTDDGLPMIEVSNREFSGLSVRHILLESAERARIMMTAEQSSYCEISGWIAIFHSQR